LSLRSGPAKTLGMEESQTNSPSSAPAFWADLETAEAALDGDEKAAKRVLDILHAPGFRSKLINRGASDTEADDLVGDLAADCFGGEKPRGGLHRLLGHFNGRCPLEGYLLRVGFNRLINLKRRQKHEAELPGDEDRREDPFDELPDSGPVEASEDAVVDLLRSAVVGALAEVDQEKLVILRLVHSYGIPQKRVGEMWEMPESTISRAMKMLREDLQHAILRNARRLDPWLDLDWEDFLDLCSGSIDLFDEVKSCGDDGDCSVDLS
jgi:RNA polymerase sigma factor (sigma-70 family)